MIFEISNCAKLDIDDKKFYFIMFNGQDIYNQYVQPDEKDLTVRKILASRYPESMLLELENKFTAFFEKN